METIELVELAMRRTAYKQSGEWRAILNEIADQLAVARKYPVAGRIDPRKAGEARIDP